MKVCDCEADTECWHLFSLCSGYELCGPHSLPQPLGVLQSPGGRRLPLAGSDRGPAHRNSHATLLSSCLTSTNNLVSECTAIRPVDLLNEIIKSE